MVGVFVGSGVGVLVGSTVGVLVGSEVGVLVGSGVGVFVGSTVGVLVGSEVDVGAGSAVAVLVGAKVDARSWLEVKVSSGNKVADVVGIGKGVWPTALSRTFGAASGALATRLSSIIQIAVTDKLSAQPAKANSKRPATITGHHRNGASLFPWQVLQNISPASRPRPHHLHRWGGNSLFTTSFAFLTICAISIVT